MKKGDLFNIPIPTNFAENVEITAIVVDKTTNLVEDCDGDWWLVKYLCYGQNRLFECISDARYKTTYNELTDEIIETCKESAVAYSRTILDYVIIPELDEKMV